MVADVLTLSNWSVGMTHLGGSLLSLRHTDLLVPEEKVIPRRADKTFPRRDLNPGLAGESRIS
jgi:hypothetical protein